MCCVRVCVCVCACVCVCFVLNAATRVDYKRTKTINTRTKDEPFVIAQLSPSAVGMGFLNWMYVPDVLQ